MDRSSPKVPWYVLLTAFSAWFGVILQCALSLKLAADTGQTMGEGITAFLGFFTVITNMLVCLAVTIPLLAPRSTWGRCFASPFALAGVAVSIAFVALSYHFLLRNVWSPHGAQWLADTVLHYVTPALYVIHWLLHGRSASLRWADPFIWSAYPTLYFVYVLVRGELIHRYPYGFIDVSAIGYGQTLVHALGLLLVFVVLGLVFVGLQRAGRRVATRVA